MTGSLGPRLCSRRSAGDLLNLVPELYGFDELPDHRLFVGPEMGGGFEGEPEVVAGSSFVDVEDEAVGADRERDGEGA